MILPTIFDPVYPVDPSIYVPGKRYEWTPRERQVLRERYLAKLDTSKPVTLADAIDAGKKAAQTMAQAPELKPEGRPRKDQKLVQSTSLGTGNSKDRLAARIKRDHPAIAAKVEAGEYKSIRAAALDAGIVRPMRSIPVDSADAAIRALLRVFSVDDLAMALGRAADQLGFVE